MLSLFLVPMFMVIGGLAAVSIPLVLHLIQSSRTVRMPYSTIRFLQLAQKKSSQKIRMENILLWLIRTLLLLAIAAGFAMPMLRNRALNSITGDAARDVAIVLDGSYSMDYQLGRTTVWEKSIDTAVGILEGLKDQDRFCIFVARENPEALIEQLSGDREEAISRLKSLTFSQTSSQLAPAIMEANEVLREAKQRRKTEIHILTDTQALPWEEIGEASADTNKSAAAMSAWDPSKIDKRTSIFVTLLGAESPENISPVSVELEPTMIMADTSARATVRLGYTGPAASTAATLFIDEEEVASRAVSADSGEPLTFILPPLSKGRHAARITLPQDNLPIDNTFHFMLKVEDQLPTLCVGGADDVFFLRAALGAAIGGNGNGAGIDVRVVEPSALPIDQLNDYSCIFLCNAVPLGASEMRALEKFADVGGLLVVFPGNRATAADYQPLPFLPGTPGSIDPVSGSDRSGLLNWDRPQHPILLGLGDSASAPAIAIKRQLTFESLVTRAEKLVSHGDAQPSLVGRPFGRGYVMMFTISADRSLSDFPLSPFFLPLVHQTVHFGAGVGSFTPYVWCADRLPLEMHLPEAQANEQLVRPTGERTPIRSATVDGQTVLHLEDVVEAGMYELNGQPALAVNMVRDEADLTPVDPITLPKRLGVPNVFIATSSEELISQLTENRVGRTFGEQLLWLALILAAFEFFYANRLMKTSGGLSDSLKVEASGKVSAS